MDRKTQSVGPARSVGRRWWLVGVGLVIVGGLTASTNAMDWPLKDKDQNTTPIVATYGQYMNYTPTEYCHAGVDIRADENTRVVAGVAGTVTKIYNPPSYVDHNQGIKITEAGGRQWIYWHVDDFKVAEGNAVAADTHLADVYGLAANWNHLHLGIGEPNGATENPLKYLAYTDTQKPTITDVRLYPNTRQGVNCFYKKTIPGTNLGVAGKDQILVGSRPQAPLTGELGDKDKSEIDVAVGAYDSINGSNHHVGLYRMGYWVDGFSYLPSSAGADPHVTFRFDGTAPNQGDGAQNLLYRDDGECDSANQWPDGSTNGAGTFWHIVTNTNDTSLEGNVNSNGLDANEAWKTKQGVDNNAKAPSPDGEYNIVYWAHDQKLNSQSDFTRVRVDNFEQKAGVAGAGKWEYLVSPTYDEDLYTETAQISPYTFDLNEEVKAMAVEMLGEDNVPVYLNWHDFGGWSEGEDIVSDAITSESFVTTEYGVTAWTPLWVTNRLGYFDIIFDYDHDGVFSYTMDGLIGFSVVPEPASLSLLLLVCLFVGRRRRR